MAQMRRVEFETSGGEKGKCLHPCKSENEGISDSCVAVAAQAGLILLFGGEVDRDPKASRRSRRAQPGRYPDFGLEPRSRLPGTYQWLWESVTRYSGATVPDFHGVPWRMAVSSNCQRAILSYAPERSLPRIILGHVSCGSAARVTDPVGSGS
jgi:hypothetical protein